jgi:hypothetical protein
MKNNWTNVKDGLPEKEGYYTVKYDDGSTDRIPFRIRPSKNIKGFMTERNVVKWK